ncbi:MAG: Ig-like domain-containing protein [Woeseiaceae bacterium]|nr:Ig-like domain-containing protein [Woeseiaceae bacterium]
MSKFNSLKILALTLVLAACSGESTLVGEGGGGTGGGGTGGGGTGGGTTDDTVRIGSGTGADFQEGVIAVSQSQLSAGGSTSLTVTFVDADGSLVGDTIDVSFTSPCVAGGLANIVESQVTTTTGSVTSTYSATGCSGDDQIRASANVDGNVLQANVTVTVEAATVGSIEFVSADPTNIGLQGTGGAGRQETSTVRFRVTDSTGGPVSGATVDFSLNTTVGGITLTPASVTSDAQGLAQTVVSAGSVATSVRVRAIVSGSSPQIAALSDQLTITTGIPDQDSVSLSLGCTNLEAWNIDGQTTNATIRMSDRFNNPVPDGTAVTFTSEGGQIGGQCQTETSQDGGAGVCSVTWVSQSPRPSNGRVTILATAIGEESFTDSNSDGRYSAGEPVMPALGEPFRDDDESGTFDAGFEIFQDFNSNGVRDEPTDPGYTGFNGLLCDADCASLETLFVSDSAILVMSSGAATITDNVVGDAITVPAGSGASTSFTLTVGDAKGNGTTIQPMAGGTTVAVQTSNGSIVGPGSYDVPCSTNDGPLNFTVLGRGR